MIYAEEKIEKYLDDPEEKEAEKYIESLRQKDGIFSIGNVDIDVANVVKRRFLCDPLKCKNTDKCRKKDNSCCTDHGVMASKKEKKAILKLFSKYKKDLYEVMSPKFNPKKMFTRDDGYEGVDYTINKNTLGSCGLSFHDPEGRIRCVIEHICRKNKLNTLEYKPMWCYMWPMALISHGDGRFFITIYCEETRKVFDIEKDEVNFKCVNEQEENDPPFFEFAESVMVHIFGRGFYEELENYASRYFEYKKVG